MNLATDGSEDNLIHCFKEREPYKAAKEILQSQLLILTEKNVNPFETDKSDAAVAAPFFCFKAVEPLRKGSLLSSKSPEAPATHLINLGRAKGRFMKSTF